MFFFFLFSKRLFTPLFVILVEMYIFFLSYSKTPYMMIFRSEKTYRSDLQNIANVSFARYQFHFKFVNEGGKVETFSFFHCGKIE